MLSKNPILTIEPRAIRSIRMQGWSHGESMSAGRSANNLII